MVSHHYDESIARAMRQVAAGVKEHIPIDTTLAELTRAAVELIDGVDYADVLLISNGEFRSISPTSPIATQASKAQEQTSQGPCVDAADRDVIVRCSDLESDRRWPQFAREARAAGVLSVVSLRLYTHDADSGALNLLGAERGSLSAEGEALGAMLATQAALLMISADREQQFESALASRDVIGQAKGIIMERFAVDAIQAFELLKRVSQESNTPVRHIAERLVKRG